MGFARSGSIVGGDKERFGYLGNAISYEYLKTRERAETTPYMDRPIVRCCFGLRLMAPNSSLYANAPKVTPTSHLHPFAEFALHLPDRFIGVWAPSLVQQALKSLGRISKRVSLDLPLPKNEDVPQIMCATKGKR